ILVVGDGYRIEGANDAAGRLAGASADALETRHCHAALFGRAIPCDPCPLATGEARFTHGRDAHERIFDARAYALPGSGKAHLCVYRDVTTTVAFERDAAQLDRMAAIGRLASGVAHELNNPLQAILTFVQLAQKRDVAAAKLPRYLEVIRESALRCRNIIQSMRTLSRSKMGDEHTLVDMAQVCDQALVLFRASYQDRVERAWPADTEYIVRANTSQIHQVVVNLIQNALDASPDEAHVRVNIEHDDGDVVMSVEDQGHGVPEREIEKIFAPFYTTKPEGVGTGLGLAISHQIMQKHGGSLRLSESTLAGARFEARLPGVSKPEAENGGRRK
ncbi:MAG: HAMP domain-containing sensor histidine kinase, partial [Myxococcota bacterium]